MQRQHAPEAYGATAKVLCELPRAEDSSEFYLEYSSKHRNVRKSNILGI